MANDGKTAPQVDRTWVLEQFKRRSLTQKDVAELMDIDPATLTYTLKGQRKLNLGELKKLSDIIQVPTAEIMARWGYPPRLESPHVPLTAYAMDDCHVVEAAKPFSLIPAPPGLPTDSFAIRVRSTDFPNSYWSNMICFVSVGSLDLHHCIGQIVFARVDPGKPLFGELSRGTEDGRYTLTHPLSKRQLVDLPLTMATPIDWFKRG
ncbi:helix-turn-helix domain-containing protein [Paraburkholderia youngii]|uniref:helix-turn-helix domain-containing protein n=1 Tax=Paraburkholderia youngii TaxID=2782701 RepID=UPI0015924054|nr:helix-turn-helix transcriptional regulator [Paraburkholderia youngii]NUX58689.1 helix-turn-helix transcriptional regulator [Paraburkholderia youngii]